MKSNYPYGKPTRRVRRTSVINTVKREKIQAFDSRSSCTSADFRHRESKISYDLPIKALRRSNCPINSEEQPKPWA
ncbi:hypothetical protein CEXT_765491 [Caerostris extrusa]|uniref:Uncharacterized protein n=1 Tax=Caerostris extrusa TaxID=172846 RepID=A0AAV4MKH1_CAEEX|nr:hypothetical protein CEXT_765491 [Caerostris extrusa]